MYIPRDALNTKRVNILQFDLHLIVVVITCERGSIISDDEEGQISLHP